MLDLSAKMAFSSPRGLVSSDRATKIFFYGISRSILEYILPKPAPNVVEVRRRSDCFDIPNPNPRNPAPAVVQHRVRLTPPPPPSTWAISISVLIDRDIDNSLHHGERAVASRRAPVGPMFALAWGAHGVCRGRGLLEWDTFWIHGG